MLLALHTGDEPDAWTALGFEVEGDTVRLGGIDITLDGAGDGVRGWTLLGAGHERVAGVHTTWTTEPGSPVDAAHPNGATVVDHVVLLTPDLDAAVDDLVANGGDLRRRVGPPEMHSKMAFVRLGPTIVEVVERGDTPSLWGLVAVVPSVDDLGDLVGEPRDAVQPGRRIASVRREAGLGTALAFMTPR